MSLNVVTVCGSGAVSSTMMAEMVTEFLEDQGFDVNATETMPGSLDSVMIQSGWDLIVTATPIEDKYGVPIVDGVALLTGRGVDEVFEKILDVLKETGKIPG